MSLIAAEDTRHTGSMLKTTWDRDSIAQQSRIQRACPVARFAGALGDGDVALVSDAGTPAVSDPGAILVRAAAEAGFSVIPVPGPSAVTAAVSASGLVDGPFMFLGFLPRRSGERADDSATALKLGIPLVIYESGNRIEQLSTCSNPLLLIVRLSCFGS